jgi:hypothetical protein
MLEAAAALHDLNDTALHQFRRRELVGALAFELDGTLGDITALGLEQIGNCFECGRLTGAIAPEEGNYAPLGNLERNALQHQDDVIVDHLDVVDGEQRFTSMLLTASSAVPLLMSSTAIRRHIRSVLNRRCVE